MTASEQGGARRYVDGPHGQLHVRTWTARKASAAPPLLCLHPVPYSGHYFSTIAPLLQDARDVVALDYPGYGGSDRGGTSSICDYAAAARAVLNALYGENTPTDILGFHTGCLVGAELSRAAPGAVRRLALIDCPYFEAKARAEMRAKIGRGLQLTPELACLEDAWAFSVARRLDAMPLVRAFDLFIEQLRAGENGADGFQAAFSYPCEEAFPKLAAPALFIATQSFLLEPTRAAAAIAPGARLCERLDITGAVMEQGAEAIASEVLTFLDAKDASGS
ncbi:MAG: alpha/beta hydrolase [Pseudomonadota bacterium]